MAEVQSEPTQPFFERGDEDAYATFKAELDPILEKRTIEDDYKAAIETIQDAIHAWADDHDGKAPPVDEVRPGGAIDDQLQADGKTWPQLTSGRQLLPGKGLGEFVYEPRAKGFKISGLAPTGQEMSWASSW